MPGPLLFFIIIILVDTILKSVKDKQRIQKKQPTVSRPMVDLKKILVEEIEKEKQREITKKQGNSAQRKNHSFEGKKANKNTINEEINKKDLSWEIIKEENVVQETKKIDVPVQIKKENQERDLRKDVLRGIVFSEILSEPKSLKNQKRSL
ncbi:hypothetical protein [Tissierella sp.]|uniref:hypothetical protein n=1 Tax=Tissierella sp. TaxID=41274 RepID=UPI0028AB34F7|nr:hypothetical protein [Tissierella sp.]